MVKKVGVEVLTTKVSVTSGGLDGEDTTLDVQEGDIESTTTKVVDQDVPLLLRLAGAETVSNGGRGGLVDDTEDVETGDQTSIFSGLALGVIEVGWDSDNSVVDGTTKVALGGLSHLGQDHRRDLLRCEVLLLALELDLADWLASLLNDLEGEVLHVGLNLSIVELAADQALRVEDCVDWVHRDLVFGGISDQTFGVSEGNERWSGSVSLVVCDNSVQMLATKQLPQ